MPDGIHAKIKKNVIVGTDFADYYRVQDGIQINWGGSADIEDNDISRNFQTVVPTIDNPSGLTYWTCSGILLYGAHEVKAKHDDIYNNGRGITIRYRNGKTNRREHGAKARQD